MSHKNKEDPSAPSWIARRWWVPVSFLVGMMGMKVHEDLAHAQAPDGRGDAFKADMREVPEHQKEAARLFYDILETHPHEEIRNDLLPLIRRGDILVSFDNSPGSEVTYAEATVTYLDTPKGQRLTLFASMEHLLLNPRMTRAMKQLIIYHEWIHAKALRRGDVPKWLVLPRDMGTPITEAELRLIFEFEYEAHLAECQLAVTMNAVNHIPSYCPAFVKDGIRGLRRALLYHYFKFAPAFAPYVPVLTRVAMERN